MGPPPFGGGNISYRTSATAHMWRLQWGHRLSAVETRIAEEYHCAQRTASMGPPPFGGGNTTMLIYTKPKFAIASMGPPPFGGGNRYLCLYSELSLRCSAVLTASISDIRRPLMFGRGAFSILFL